eukprot:2177002-Pyramimonas_sp.AAC.1
MATLANFAQFAQSMAPLFGQRADTEYPINILQPPRADAYARSRSRSRDTLSAATEKLRGGQDDSQDL